MIYYVTGATGFLGSRLVEILRSQGHRVIATGRNREAGLRLESMGATFTPGNLSDRAFVMESMPENAVVVHCAALSSPWGTRKAFYEANVVATQNVVDAAMAKKCTRFVHISTPSIYIDQFSKLMIQESSPLPAKQINLYSETKLEAEKVVDLATKAGLPAISIRPQGLFGPRDQTILPRLLRIAERGSLPVIGDGKTEMDLTYVDNVVDSILLAVQADPSHYGKKYNITNGEPMNQVLAFQTLLNALGFKVELKKIKLPVAWAIASILEAVYRTFALKGEPLLTRYSVCVLAFSRTLNIENAKRDLGYIPKVSIQEGVERTVQWYKASRS